MNQLIERLPAPEWLMRQTAVSIQDEPFPRLEVLKDSLYYAGAGTDGSPVKYFGGNVYSFVYSDYLVHKETLLSRLLSDRTGFLGFHIVGIRELALDEVVPDGWYRAGDLDYRLWSYERGNPGEFLRHDAPQPYAIWAVFERDAGRDPLNRPERFSLLHVCFESIAVYSALYLQSGILPRILYLINHGFGANWTDFEDGKRLYAQTVASHPQGLPLYLAGRSFRQATIQQTTESRRSFWSRLYPGEPLGEVWPDGFLLWKRREYSQTRRSRMEARHEKPDDELPV